MRLYDFTIVNLITRNLHYHISLSRFYHAYYFFINVFFYNLNNDLIELRPEILSHFLHFYL